MWWRQNANLQKVLQHWGEWGPFEHGTWLGWAHTSTQSESSTWHLSRQKFIFRDWKTPRSILNEGSLNVLFTCVNTAAAMQILQVSNRAKSYLICNCACEVDCRKSFQPSTFKPIPKFLRDTVIGTHLFIVYKVTREKYDFEAAVEKPAF